MSSLGARFLCGAIVIGGLYTLACYDPDNYTLSPGAIDSLLDLRTTRGDSALPADGFSRITIVAVVDSNSPKESRTISFTTSAGTLTGGTAVGSAQEVTADATGRASIDLQSVAVVQVARVRAEIKGGTGVARQIDISFVPVSVDSIIRFRDVPDSLPADGASVATVTVTVAPALPTASRTVQFQSSLVVFVQNNGSTLGSTADAGNVAFADIRTPSQIGLAHITATVGGFAQDTTIPVVWAYPDTVLLDPGLFTMKVTEQAPVVATLLRRIGKPTPNTFVTFTAFDSTGTSRGQFRAIQESDPQGLAKASFQPIGVTPPALLTLRALVDGNGKAASATIQVVP